MTDNPNRGAGSKQARYEIAKGVLAAARTGADRERSIETAMDLGMPLNQIEEYLDWLEQNRPIPDDEEGLVEESRDRSRRPKPRWDEATEGNLKRSPS